MNDADGFNTDGDLILADEMISLLSLRYLTLLKIDSFIARRDRNEEDLFWLSCRDELCLIFKNPDDLISELKNTGCHICIISEKIDVIQSFGRLNSLVGVFSYF